jgi:hypothetical protein
MQTDASAFEVLKEILQAGKIKSAGKRVGYLSTMRTYMEGK